MTNTKYAVWLIMHEFPQFNFENIRKLTLSQVDFLLKGIQRYYPRREEKSQFG